MSWYTDPQLYIHGTSDPIFVVFVVTKKFGDSPINRSDLKQKEDLNFSKHLSLDNNKESDFDAFKATFPTSGIEKMINCQGLVIRWDFPKQAGTWSHEEHNSPFWRLPGITEQVLADKEALEGKVSDLEAKISSLEDEVTRKKVEKEAVDNRVSDLEAENAILKDEVSKGRDEIAVDGLKREEILAGLEALDKQVSDLTSKFV